MKLNIRFIIPITIAMVFATIAIVSDLNTKQEFTQKEASHNEYYDVQMFNNPYIKYYTTTPINETPDPEPAAYQEIADVITDDEIEMLARLLFLEAGNQQIEGQRAVIEVIFNRLLSDEFPNTLNEVVYAKNQFSPAHLISSTTPTEEQYEVIQIVLTDTETVLDRGVVFFSLGQYNDYLYDKIGDHYFCYSTNSYQNKMKGTEQ